MPETISSSQGVVYGQPLAWLRVEGAVVLGTAIAAYALGGHAWVWFALFFFLPDITILGYLSGPRRGAFCYNAVHNYAVPLAAGVLLHLLDQSITICLVWVAHIGFDRLLGYGLKYADGFGQTHLAGDRAGAARSIRGWGESANSARGSTPR